MVSKKKSSTKRRPKKSSSRARSKSRLLSLLASRAFISLFLLTSVLFVLYVIYLDIRLTHKFEGRIWSLPSHVYARPLELFIDQTLSARHFEHELQLIGYRKVSQIPGQPGEYRYWDQSHFELVSHDFIFPDGLQKSRALRIDFANDRVSGVYDLYSHQPIALLRLEPARIAGIYPTQVEDRELIKLDQVPDYLVLTLLSVEDRRFYEHWGLDPRSILRAMLANLSAGGTVQGGSTLTQQLVKNLFLSPERSIWRKFNEAIMSLLLEFHYDKALILETYLNEVYLGQQGANQIHGFALASHFYFDKPLNKLGKDQLALLVGLVKGPSWYDPRRHPQRAIERRNQVLGKMHEQRVITDAQFEIYKVRPLDIVDHGYRSSNRYPAFIDLVKRQLLEDYDEDDLRTSGLKIFTTLDPLVQKAAETAVEEGVGRLEKFYPMANQLQAAVIVASPENGEIQAVVGDRQPEFPGFNRALDAIRQVGSLIKPAIYLAALQQPEKYNLATLLDDSPLHLKARNGDIWSPENYDKEFMGDIPLYKSLLLSRNVPTVRLGLEIGLSDIVDTLKDLGIKREVPPYPSMTLGAFNLSPLDVAAMYQTLAAKGFNIPMRAIREVLDQHSKPLNRYPLKLHQTLKPEPVYLVNTVLNEVTRTGTAASLKMSLPVNVAGKTGTTDDLRDSWFAGFSEDRLAVVWLGRDDNQSTGLTGASGALKIWTHLMQQIPLQDLHMELPETLETHWIDSQTGGISEKGCRGAVELAFLPGSAPRQRAECTSSFFERLFN